MVSSCLVSFNLKRFRCELIIKCTLFVVTYGLQIIILLLLCNGIALYILKKEQNTPISRETYSSHCCTY